MQNWLTLFDLTSSQLTSGKPSGASRCRRRKFAKKSSIDAVHHGQVCRPAPRFDENTFGGAQRVLQAGVGDSINRAACVRATLETNRISGARLQSSTFGVVTSSQRGARSWFAIQKSANMHVRFSARAGEHFAGLRPIFGGDVHDLIVRNEIVGRMLRAVISTSRRLASAKFRCQHVGRRPR
jgi:hypothetical protein